MPAGILCLYHRRQRAGKGFSIRRTLRQHGKRNRTINQGYVLLKILSLMKKHFIIGLLALTTVFTVLPTKKSDAFVWVVVKEALKKVIKAIDIKVQQLQNKTIALQNAQKQIENTLSKTKLKEISDWAKKQKELYKNYYEELLKVKNTIALFQKVRRIIQRQKQIVIEYNDAFSLFKRDRHFNPQEIRYMSG